MLGIIAAVLIVLWLLGFFAFHVTSGLIHIVLVVRPDHAVVPLSARQFRQRVNRATARFTLRIGRAGSKRRVPTRQRVINGAPRVLDDVLLSRRPRSRPWLCCSASASPPKSSPRLSSLFWATSACSPLSCSSMLIVRGLYESVKWLSASTPARAIAKRFTPATAAGGVAFERRIPIPITSLANQPRLAELTFHPALNRRRIAGNYSSNHPGGTPR